MEGIHDHLILDIASGHLGVRSVAALCHATRELDTLLRPLLVRRMRQVVVLQRFVRRWKHRRCRFVWQGARGGCFCYIHHHGRALRAEAPQEPNERLNTPTSTPGGVVM